MTGCGSLAGKPGEYLVRGDADDLPAIEPFARVLAGRGVRHSLELYRDEALIAYFHHQMPQPPG